MNISQDKNGLSRRQFLTLTGGVARLATFASMGIDPGWDENIVELDAKGIFAFDQSTSKMSLDAFVDEVSRSALGTNNPVYTRQMAEHSLARVNELMEWGFFDSPLYNKTFSKPIVERNIPC